MRFIIGFPGQASRTSEIELEAADAGKHEALSGYVVLVLKTGDCWVQTYMSAADARRLALEINAEAEKAEMAAVAEVA